ncbi:MAG: sulfite reductase subunit alpha, partial [Planctomycetota bacterium]
MTSTLVPDSAPFNEEQRAWLNGFLAGYLGVQSNGSADTAATGNAALPAMEEEEDLDDAAWHDSGLSIDERMTLAEGKPVAHRMMAAMAQLDCGSCGYVCKTYSAAIACGEESNLTLCTPGGKETKQMLKKLAKESQSEESGSTSQSTASTDAASDASDSSNYSRKSPFAASLIESRLLNREGSAKDTRHVAIDLADSGIQYEVGDALGVFPTNCPELVCEILSHLQIACESMITLDGAERPINEILERERCLKEPTDELLELLIAKSSGDIQAKLEVMLEDGAPEGFDVLDALSLASSASLTASELLETLPPLTPRLYSIASSQRCVGDSQVHLTVGKVSYELDDRLRKGVASTMFSDRLATGSEVRVFVQPNHAGFTVPVVDESPMIMVGPGTGIAPFIAFLQERQIRNASGKNWLFFGDQRSEFDFLYQAELEEWQQTGLLTNLHTAFSRDGDQKVYVQDRMRENAAEIWQWLEEGASFFVCGDAKRMAKDVDQALKKIVSQEGKLSDQEASDYVAK